MVLWEKNITNLGPSCEEKVLTLPIYFHCAVEGLFFFVTMKYRILIKEQIKKPKEEEKIPYIALFKNFNLKAVFAIFLPIAKKLVYLHYSWCHFLW